VTIQRIIAVVMILGSSVLTAWASGDIAFPAILCMLGLLGVQRRFTWDIRPERHFVTPLLLLLLATLFAIHCRYAHVRADQAAAFAWQTIARYFLASMILILFLRPQRTQDRGRRTEDRGPLAESIGPPSSIVRPPICGLPPSLGLFHLASAMAAGQVLLLDDRYVVFRLAALLSVTLVLFYAMAGHEITGPRTEDKAVLRPPLAVFRDLSSVLRHLVSGIRSPAASFVLPLLLVAINLGWIGGSLLYRHVEVINFLPAWLSRGSVALEGGTAEVAHVGFSTSGKLASVLSIKEDADSAPVLSITGDSNPIYLRAMAFESYRPSEWLDRSDAEVIPPEQSTPFGVHLVGRAGVFRLHENDAPRSVTIRHEVAMGDAMFTPLGTCTVEAPLSLLKRDDDDIVSSLNVHSRLSYRVAYVTPSAGNPPTELQARRMRAVPTHLDQRIRQSANRIFRGCTTTAEKIEAVTKYFHTNYTYTLGLEVPAEQDALNFFLLEASSGYCEYFASGAAVLLRLVGVPTRYVTGFLVTERGSDGRSWIARNMDAHAWAEAWDQEQRQWCIVEATAQEGLDDVSLADELVRGASSGRPFLTQLVQSLYEYGLFGVVGRLFASYGLITGGLLSMAFFAAAVWVALRRRRRPQSTVLRALSSDVSALHQLLATMDRKTAALGYRRNPDETLHAFAARIRCGWNEARASSPKSDPCLRGGDVIPAKAGIPNPQSICDWYLQYADLRYCRVVDPGRVQQLQQIAQKRR
jgi:hypothetical protein